MNKLCFCPESGTHFYENYWSLMFIIELYIIIGKYSTDYRYIYCSNDYCISNAGVTVFNRLLYWRSNVENGCLYAQADEGVDP